MERKESSADAITIAFEQQLPVSSAHNGSPVKSNTECSIAQCAFTIVNTTVGAGIIGLPFAFKGAGFGFGLLMTFTVAYLTNAALILMIYAGNRVNVSTYAGLARAGLGPIGSFLVTTAVLMNGLGTMVSYLIIIGSEIPKLSRFYLPGFALLSNRTAMVILLSCVCIAPLLFWKSIGRLKNVSIIGVLCVPIIVLTVFYRSFISPGYYQDHQVNFDFFGQNVFPSMGVMSFAFVSNHTAFMSYQTLRDRSVQRWIKATFMALTAALLISLSLAVVGYSAFGEDLQANVLAVFPADDNYINFASLVLACSMFVSYPMQFYPSRVALLTLLGRESLAESPSTAIHYPYSVAERKQRRWRYRLVTVLLFAFTVLIAVLVEDLGKVYELVGAVCSSAIAFLLPGAAAFAILYRNSPQQQQKQSSADSTDETSALLHEKSSPVNGYNTGLRQEIFAKVLSAIVFLFGVLVLVAGTSQTIYSIFQ